MPRGLRPGLFFRQENETPYAVGYPLARLPSQTPARISNGGRRNTRHPCLCRHARTSRREATSRNHTAEGALRLPCTRALSPSKQAKEPRRVPPSTRSAATSAMEAGAALDEAMDALAQKNEDLTEDVQTFAKALDGLGEPLSDAKAGAPATGDD